VPVLEACVMAEGILANCPSLSHFAVATSFEGSNLFFVGKLQIKSVNEARQARILRTSPPNAKARLHEVMSTGM
jgi:hypothetical protein